MTRVSIEAEEVGARENADEEDSQARAMLINEVTGSATQATGQIDTNPQRHARTLEAAPAIDPDDPAYAIQMRVDAVAAEAMQEEYAHRADHGHAPQEYDQATIGWLHGVKAGRDGERAKLHQDAQVDGGGIELQLPIHQSSISRSYNA